MGCPMWQVSVLPRTVVLASHPQQAGQSGEVVGGHCQDEARSHPLDATIDGLGHAADGLGPAEGLLNPLSVPQGEGITFMAGGAPIDGGIPRFLRDMRGNTGMPEIPDKVGTVVSLVGPECQPPGRSGGMAMHHVERGAALCVTVRLGQVALNNQPVPVPLCQRSCPPLYFSSISQVGGIGQ